MKTQTVILSIFLTLSWHALVIGQKADESATIESESLTLNLKEKQGVFTGKVKVVHPNFELLSDEVIVFFADKNKVARMLAKGKVRIKQLDRASESREAEYLVGEKKILLTGNPVVTQGENVVTGNVITIYPETDKMEVTGRSKVQFFIEE